ncbi:hypothetical protein PFICI_10543 [Pestalotiopsis fici W106-1]|uniref:RNA helicase n=1 Tax=Pestalotiopsis fici (strain W106-1 / CGMCC3.15140) TaxID=1229662 RepID=W3X015_PESFW|nr:uncharacterized protein PFICI_10543 [Pestalotiopsis fici W106-1]ETS78481.1 hypothetical protein PFICI_10543 [Pestalotiopsis fici W106-1]
MSDSWGPEPTADADTGDWGVGTGDAGIDDADFKPVPPPLPFEHRDAPVAEWEKTTPYDYQAMATNDTGDWDGNAQVYYWDGEMGDIGPEHPELEKALFGEESLDNDVIDFTTITQIEVRQEGEQRIIPIKSFDAAGLHPVMLKNIRMAGFTFPTPIQQYSIPAIHMGHDLIAIAQTGSGKTAAYLIPIINKLMGKAKKLAAPRPNPVEVEAGVATSVTAEPLVVVVCPARELAIQIFNVARKFCYRTMLRPVVIYGGGPLRDQVYQLQRGCDILVASPGRLVDMMERPSVLSLRRVRYMVVDEADEMLHQDWEEEFNKILSGGEQEEGNVKYMLFSATFPTQIRKLAKDHLAASHLRINVGRVGSTHANIEQQIIWVDNSMKKQALCDLLFSLEPKRTIIFVNNRRLADELDDYLFNKDMPCTSMHADRTQREREDAMRAFRNGTTPILIATGVTARGIDVRNVGYVINYDLPSVDHGGITEYTHRIGRTARAGRKGQAFSFYTERDEPLAELLTKTLLETKQEIPEFLKQYVPENADIDQLKFEPDSDEEIEGEDTGGWGAGNGDGDAGSWGAENNTSNGGDSAGWGTDNNASNGGDSASWGATGNDAGDWGGNATAATASW